LASLVHEKTAWTAVKIRRRLWPPEFLKPKEDKQMETSSKQAMVSGVIAKGMYQKVKILWKGQRVQYETLTKEEYRELIHRIGSQTP